MSPEHALARRFAETARQLSSDGMASGLQQAVDLAAEMIPGCDYAGITVIQPGNKSFTPAATAGRAVEVDQLQYDLNEGPCLDTANRGMDWVQIDDLATEPRWPRFCAGARDMGIASILSCDLESPRGMLGALNLYSELSGAFGASSRESAAIYATHAALALSAQRMQDSLRAAMDSRETIGIAMGVLMERHKVTRSQAFDLLAQVSQETNTKLRELAHQVVTTGEDPQTA